MIDDKLSIQYISICLCLFLQDKSPIYLHADRHSSIYINKTFLPISNRCLTRRDKYIRTFQYSRKWKPIHSSIASLFTSTSNKKAIAHIYPPIQPSKFPLYLCQPNTPNLFYRRTPLPISITHRGVTEARVRFWQTKLPILFLVRNCFALTYWTKKKSNLLCDDWSVNNGPFLL